MFSSKGGCDGRRHARHPVPVIVDTPLLFLPCCSEDLSMLPKRLDRLSSELGSICFVAHYFIGIIPCGPRKFRL